MSAPAHLIEIDELVLEGVDPDASATTTTLVAAELQRRIVDAAPADAARVDVGHTAHEVARVVAQSVHGVRHG